jgi:DGQHR domain-containing protein
MAPKQKAVQVRALRVVHGKEIPVYSFFLTGKQLLDLADISRLNRNEQDVLLGYQRGEVKRHVGEIADYLKGGDILFPNAIILALSSDVKFKGSRGPKVGDAYCAPGVLSIPQGAPGKRVAWIVDGQQRTLALSRSKVTDLPVPVTAFVSDDFGVHRSQFLLVNKARPLPKALIDELLPEVNTSLPQSLSKRQIPSHLCNLLNKDKDSPFYGTIARYSGQKKDKKAVITDNSLISAIGKSLRSPQGCLFPYQELASGNVEVTSVLRILNLYWGGVRFLFPRAWGLPAEKSRLMHGVGIKALGNVMDQVMARIDIDSPTAEKDVVTALSPIVPHCAWTGGHWDKLQGQPEWNSLQNVTRHVSDLTKMLVRVVKGLE